MRIAAFVMVHLLVVHAAAFAEDRYVATTGTDTGSCESAAAPCRTINYALARPGTSVQDTVFVAAGIYTGTGSEVVRIERGVDLLGGWDAAFAWQVGYSTVDGEGVRRGILGAPASLGQSVRLERFIVERGVGLGEQGGGIRTGFTMSVTLSRCIVRHNQDGGFFSSHSLVMIDSVVSDNANTSGGGGIEVDGIGGVNVDNSAILRNTTTTEGGGIKTRSSVSLRNTTVSGNHAQGVGGGIAALDSSFVTLSHVTITNNTAQSGGGVAFDASSLAPRRVFASVLAGNVASGGTGPDCMTPTPLTSEGGNVLGVGIAPGTTNCLTAHSADQVGTAGAPLDARLGPLAENGGPPTHALLPGSPALDVIVPRDTVVGALRDQRGQNRPLDANGDGIVLSDAGAFELVPPRGSQIVAGDLDGNGRDEVIIDFGPVHGLWVHWNHTTWAPLHPFSPRRMVTGDVDGNGQDEVIIDFGSPYGLYIWINNTSWTPLHATSAEDFVTGDLDGNGQDEVIVDFGAHYGLYIWQNNTNWVQLHALPSHALAAGDVDGNGQDDVVVDFGRDFGLWLRRNESTWVKLDPASPRVLALADLDGNGEDEVIADFGYGGSGSLGQLRVWRNGTGWGSRLSHSSVMLVTGDLDGGGRAELIGVFPIFNGLWINYNNTSWTHALVLIPELLATADMDGNGQDELIADFGPTYGIWVWQNNATWMHLHGISP